MCGKTMCRGCLVPFRPDKDETIQAYFDRCRGNKSLEEHYEGGQELAIRLTWSRHTPINLLFYLSSSIGTTFRPPEKIEFGSMHPECKYEEEKGADRNYKQAFSSLDDLLKNKYNSYVHCSDCKKLSRKRNRFERFPRLLIIQLARENGEYSFADNMMINWKKETFVQVNNLINEEYILDLT